MLKVVKEKTYFDSFTTSIYQNNMLMYSIELFSDGNARVLKDIDYYRGTTANTDCFKILIEDNKARRNAYVGN